MLRCLASSFSPFFSVFCLGSPHRRRCAPVVERALDPVCSPSPLSLSSLFLLRPSRTILRLLTFCVRLLKEALFGQKLPNGFPLHFATMSGIFPSWLIRVCNIFVFKPFFQSFFLNNYLLSCVTYDFLSPAIGPNGAEILFKLQTSRPWPNLVGVRPPWAFVARTLLHSSLLLQFLT